MKPAQRYIAFEFGRACGKTAARAKMRELRKEPHLEIEEVRFLSTIRRVSYLVNGKKLHNHETDGA